MSTEMQELHLYIPMLRDRIASASAFRRKIQQLDACMLTYKTARPEMQSNMLRQAVVFLSKSPENVPQTLRKNIDLLVNELTSLQEGVAESLVSQEEFQILSSPRILEKIDSLIQETEERIARAEERMGASSGPSTTLLQDLRRSVVVPELGAANHVAFRGPVVFSFLNGRHSSVGYIEERKIEEAGFRASNLEGYTVLYDQLLLGVRASSEKISVSRVVSTGGRQKIVQREREGTMYDTALSVLAHMSVDENRRFSLVSEKPSRADGISWFWAGADSDLSRLSRAWPGGHLQVSSWGTAF